MDIWFPIMSPDIRNSIGGPLFQLISESINSRYKNLKRVTIRNDNYLEFIDQIKFNNIRITHVDYQYVVSNEYPSNIKEIDYLGCYALIKQNDQKTFFKSLNKLRYLHCGDNIDFKNIYDSGNGNNQCCFNFTKSIRLSISTFQNLYYLLLLVPYLVDLNMGICVDKLIYLLTGCGNDNRAKQCGCLNISNITTDTDSLKKYNNLINVWSNISKLITNHKHLKQLSISHKCNSSNTNKLLNENLSNILKDEFKIMLSKNSSIESFTFLNIQEEK